MNRKIEVTCEKCNSVNKFSSDELVSGMSIKDDSGKIIEEHPAVEIDENMFIQCDQCGAPVSCRNAKMV